MELVIWWVLVRPLLMRHNRDYRLTSSSVLIGAGIASSDVLDIKGTTRPTPSGSKPDIGPYENALDKPDLIFAPYFATQTSPHCCYYTARRYV